MTTRLIVTLSCIVLVPSLVISETDGELYELPDYNVTARHFEQSVLDVPSDVVQVSRDQIDRSLATSVPELLALEANLFFSTLSGRTNVAMRGFGEGSGLRSLILIDGQPLNPADMGRVNWEQVPLDSVESIEVLRGGNNVLYGDKALAGVIKIETRRSGVDRLDLEGRWGSYGSESASAGATMGVERLSVNVGASLDASDGYRENSELSSRHAYAGLGYTFVTGDDLDLRLSVGEVESQYPGGLDYEAYRSNPRASENLGDEGSENTFATLTGRLQGRREWGSWQVMGGADWSDTDWSLGAGSYGVNEQVGFSLRPRARLGDEQNALIVGMDVLYDTLEFSQYQDEAHSLMLGDAEVSEGRVSPYFLVERELFEGLTLSAGLRHEWVRYEVDYLNYVIEVKGDGNRPGTGDSKISVFDDGGSFAEAVNVNGSAAEVSLNYRLSSKWSVWTGYDRVYRYPVFDERASYQGFPLAENVSPELEAEEGDNFELGLKYIGVPWEFYLTGFVLNMDNEIIFDPTVEGSNDAKGLNINLGPVERRGTDVALIYRRKQWGCSTRIAFVQTEMRAGEGAGYEVPLVPSVHTVSQLWVEPVDWLSARFVHRYVGEQYGGGDFTNSGRTIEDYHLFDLNAEFAVSSECRVFFSLTNLLDQRYAESAYHGSYYPGAGRSIAAGVKLNF